MVGRKIFHIACILLYGMAGCSPVKNNDKVIHDKQKAEVNRNPVEILVLQPSTFRKEQVSNGKIKARHKSSLNFGIDGRLREIRVKNGDHVNKGEVIAILDQEKMKQALKQASLQLDRARLDLMDLMIGLGYQIEDSASVPQNILKNIELRSDYTSAQNNLQDARINLKNTELRAPFSGVVANIRHKVFEQVNTAEDFCTIIDNSEYELAFMVLETEIGDVSLNKPVRASPFSRKDEVFEGKVTEINPVVDENGLIQVKALVRNTKHLMEGMNMRVSMITDIPDKLVVPKAAVVLRQNQEVLFKYNNGKALWTYVQTGYENSTSYTVNFRSGKAGSLAPGDTVIISGNLNLANNSEVEIQ